MKSVTLNVCQGIGDIFWVYQKFAPHVNKINFNIAFIEGGDLVNSLRAVPFLKLLPKVDKVGVLVTNDVGYHNIADQYHDMKPILDKVAQNRLGPFDYACNRPLEEGIRLEKIDSYAIEETVNIRSTPIPLIYPPQQYITLYASGATRHEHVTKVMGAWTVHLWTKFMVRFYDKYDLQDMPICVIGASFDRDIAERLAGSLRRKRFDVNVYIDMAPENVIYLIKNTMCFIGYQSGLNILADNLDVKQVMLYFQHLDKMQNAWAKYENIKNHTFNCDLFTRKPKQVIEDLQLVL